MFMALKWIVRRGDELANGWEKREALSEEGVER